MSELKELLLCIAKLNAVISSLESIGLAVDNESFQGELYGAMDVLLALCEKHCLFRSEEQHAELCSAISTVTLETYESLYSTLAASQLSKEAY